MKTFSIRFLLVLSAIGLSGANAEAMNNSDPFTEKTEKQLHYERIREQFFGKRGCACYDQRGLLAQLPSITYAELKSDDERQDGAIDKFKALRDQVVNAKNPMPHNQVIPRLQDKRCSVLAEYVSFTQKTLLLDNIIEQARVEYNRTWSNTFQRLAFTQPSLPEFAHNFGQYQMQTIPYIELLMKTINKEQQAQFKADRQHRRSQLGLPKIPKQ